MLGGRKRGEPRGKREKKKKKKVVESAVNLPGFVFILSWKRRWRAGEEEEDPRFIHQCPFFFFFFFFEVSKNIIEAS